MRFRIFSIVVGSSLFGCHNGSTPGPEPSPTVESAPAAALPKSAAAPTSSDAPKAPEPEASASAATAPTALPLEKSPEGFAKGMKGTIECGKAKCKAGKELCVAAPDPKVKSRCEPIASWVDHMTPSLKSGAPPMAGLRGCDNSQNCPEGSFCCLHHVGSYDVQAVVCHATLAECDDHREVCSGKAAGQCRSPGTHCEKEACVE